jgi:hypothetical protein
MKQLSILAAILILNLTGFSQSRFPKYQVSINGFRNPSIGAEFHFKQLSAHGGYYPTNFESSVTTEFLKAGLTYYFLPIGKKEIPSSFYGSLSFARGLTREYKQQNVAIGEVGFRWMIYAGLNFRIGVAALVSEENSLKVNPTPGLSYSFVF